MWTARLKIELFIPQSNSLKQKRQVLRSLKDRLKNKFNLAIAEQANDKWQRAIIFLAVLKNNKADIDSTLSAIESFLKTFTAVEVIDYEREVF